MAETPAGSWGCEVTGMGRGSCQLPSGAPASQGNEGSREPPWGPQLQSGGSCFPGRKQTSSRTPASPQPLRASWAVLGARGQKASHCEQTRQSLDEVIGGLFSTQWCETERHKRALYSNSRDKTGPSGLVVGKSFGPVFPNGAATGTLGRMFLP